ncbi:CotH kinase family protein [Tellurirhabdus rosea]|uniref:CotH kinase family protein n=1 Tax=Tellurirhabdus rosea TaxID=2674997 RepID=UPI0022521498|nr:CotH kinase family protein [Tellurirhabdus rosea]
MKKPLLSLLAFLTAVGTACCQTFSSSSIPIVVIDTKGATIPDEPKITADLHIINNGPGQRNRLTDRPALTTKIGIERRGATSQQFFPKKPYGLETRDAAGVEGVSMSVLGLPEEEDWVLNATYNDKTLLREVLTYDIYRRMSRYWATNTRFCEVVLNGQYEGIYILMERLKRDRNRVNIANLRTTDNSGDALTGGYILKIDKTEGAPARSWTSPHRSEISGRSMMIQVEHPKIEDLTDTQFQYIRKYITDVENAFAAPNYQDAQTGVRQFIDEESFVDYVLINEIARNVDAYRLSTFFYKDRDSRGGKLTMGPIWDFNLSYGNADYCDGFKHVGWAFDFNRVCPGDGYQVPFWWSQLMKDRQFSRKLSDKYTTLRKTVLATDRLEAYIDSAATALREPRERNFQRWPVIGQKVWPNYFVGRTYEEEVSFLKTWLRNRLAWMDENLPRFSQDVLAAEPAEPTAILTAGTDPQTRGLTVAYHLAKPGKVRLTLMDILGRSLGQNSPLDQSSGRHQVQFGTSDSAGGLQLLVLEVDGVAVDRLKVLRP